MIPPSGFKSEVYPLYHKIKYSVGLNLLADDINSTILTFIRHYKTVNAPKTIEVNPHNTNYQEDYGSVCTKMSIIKNFKLNLKFNLTEDAFVTDKPRIVKFLWRPIFFSFPEKLDAADDDTATTVATILNLVKDATEEDVTPLFTNSKFPIVGDSDLLQPLSTANLTETFAIQNMDTDATMEEVAHDEDLFQNAMRRYTNKGALRACVGQTRYTTLNTESKIGISFGIKGVPRAVRRIMPYTYFGILIHLPISADISQSYNSLAISDNIAHLGCKAICTYEEWNADHYQEMAGTP